MSRCILFAEVPGFYAAVERAQDPSLADRPVIVGGDPRKRGLVQAATPDALAAGVVLEMPMAEALRLCPRARARRTNMKVYREVSRRLLACLRRGVPRLERFGLGGAYFDLSAPAPSDPPPEQRAAELRDAVARELGLALRAGIASGRFLARLAAEESGAAGIRRVAPGQEDDLLCPLPAGRLEGVGRKTEAGLAELGVSTIGQVRGLGRERLEQVFGAHGLRIFTLASGLDETPVRAARHPQSLSREVTVRGEALDRAVLEEHLLDLARQLEEELTLQALAAGQVALKVRYADQSTQSRSRALGGASVTRAADIHRVAQRLLERSQLGSRPVRGLGLQLARLAPATESDRQLDLFPPGD